MAVDDASSRREHSNISSSRGKNKKDSPTKNKQHANSSSSKNNKGGRKKIVCYNCGEEGHIRPKCPHPKRESSNVVKDDKEGTTTEENDSVENKKEIVLNVSTSKNKKGNRVQFAGMANSIILPTNNNIIDFVMMGNAGRPKKIQEKYLCF